eukprot:NODE_31417_length_397_cov_1.659259.p1 GENE.NODE_31417_length_397_cov_1.659259~~NODE_31417_length_397_cov_1.659259.p1  ORF type:complete len:122 (+),score=38.07 NODE_31417_length_397_cov_1.659259:1-366(+)
MLDLLMKDLTKEMTEATLADKYSQADYEMMMTDSAAKRTQDSKALVNRRAEHVNFESSFADHAEERASVSKERAETVQYGQALHAGCDWMLEHFDARKAARANELQRLSEVKAVLSGADFS